MRWRRMINTTEKTALMTGAEGEAAEEAEEAVGETAAVPETAAEAETAAAAETAEEERLTPAK